ncbi:hypothetical protein BJV74DRAFT_821832 [Russula compacta]|nr:hypothetical protein BJV74DRAFT_821832 [Russula compacta]
MEKMWTDEVITAVNWGRFIDTMLNEWDHMIVPSTVMLSANVGFLAIPGVVLSNLNGSNLTSANQVIIFTSPAQVVSCLSTIASVANIVIALLLIRLHYLKQDEDPADVSTHLYLSTHRIFGLEPLAIAYSLPWALWMWSYVFSSQNVTPGRGLMKPFFVARMITFFIALLLVCFTISNTPTRISVAIMSVFAAGLIVWCIRTASVATEDFSVWRVSLVVLERTREDLLRRVKQFVTMLVALALSPLPTRRTSESVHTMRSMADRQSGVRV